MPNKTINALIFCPFYIAEAKSSITCEGIVGAATVSRFPSEEEKTYHEANFCMGQTCSGCGVYSALMTNYSPSPKRRVTEFRH